MDGPLQHYFKVILVFCFWQWLEKVQLLFHGKAEEANIYILQCCGFDSIPNEMGMQFMKEQFDGENFLQM